MNRTAARIPSRVAVGDPQALDEGLAIRDVRVERRLPVVVVEASRGFLLDLPSLHQLIEPRGILCDRPLADRESVRRLDRQTAELVGVGP